jgi:heat shock protein HslJ
MKNLRLISLLAVFGILLAACGGGAQGASLTSSSWTLTSLNGAPLAEGSAPITLEFSSETELGGQGGCNGYGGNYTAGADGSIDISQLVSTMMACEPQIIMENEAAYLQALESVTHYSISGDTLTLDNGDAILIFSRA